MANLVYKRSTTTSLKTAGLIDVEKYDYYRGR